MPAGLTVAAVAAFVAYGAAYLASVVDNLAGKGILVVGAGLAITVAWVWSWMVVESTFFDWQPAAPGSRLRSACALHPRSRHDECDSAGMIDQGVN